MKVEDRDRYLTELRMAILGIENTEEKGMAGDIKEIKDQLKKQNGKITKNRVGLVGLACLLIGAGIFEATDVIHIFGG